MNRRILLTGASAFVPLALLGCAADSAAVTLDTAKQWLGDIVNATLAAANAYLAGPPAPSAANAALVGQIMDKLDVLKAAFDAVTVASDARGIALQVLPLLNSLLPIVGPFLPPGVAVLVSLGISVVTAFVQSLPPPPDVPPAPPAALHRAAMAYRPRH